MGRRWFPSIVDPCRADRPKQIERKRAHRIFNAWVAGMPYAEVAAKEGITVDQLRVLITRHVKILRESIRKWHMAEARCLALSMELRLLRIGKEAPPDQPIETLNPPKCWLTEFHHEGIMTVNQLRAVDSEMLLSRWQFPIGAVDWAVMKLDKLGLSHVLRRPKVRRIYRPRLSKKVRVER
jgi:DNA-binding CsgD family transcriptional regulator